MSSRLGGRWKSDEGRVGVVGGGLRWGRGRMSWLWAGSGGVAVDRRLGRILGGLGRRRRRGSGLRAGSGRWRRGRWWRS